MAMEFSGEYRIPAPQQRVWDALNDPAHRVRTVGGRNRITYYWPLPGWRRGTVRLSDAGAGSPRVAGHVPSLPCAHPSGPHPGDPASLRLTSAKSRMGRDYSRRLGRTDGCTKRFWPGDFRVRFACSRRYGRTDGYTKRFWPGNVDPRVACARHRNGCIRQVRIDVRGAVPLHCRVAIPDASAVRRIVLPHARPPVQRVHWVHRVYRVHRGRV